MTEVEEVVCDWLRQLTGLSEQWQGTIHDTASTACLTALLLAREKTSNYSESRGGLQAEPRPLIVYTTEEAHSSVTKATLLAGFGKDNLRMIEVDKDNNERTLAPGEVIEIKPGQGFGKKHLWKRG